MGETTGIDWCDATFNPWIGCSNVSPGCGHCYAKTLSEGRMGLDVWYDRPRKITSPANWKKPPRWARMAREGLLPDGSENRDGHRPRVFCASMADVFEERDELRGPRFTLLSMIIDTPELDWLVLTKRPEFARDFLRKTHSHAKPWDTPMPPNLWIGTSIENSRYTWRADVLREIPAAVHFISAEPLLGSLYDSRPLSKSVPAGPTVGDDATEGSTDTRGRAPLDLTHIEWVIVGGESGPGYRKMDVLHAREILRDVLARDPHEPMNPWSAARPAFFFKQHGGPTPKAGGKLLDGREWCEFPEPSRDLIPA